MGSLPNIYAQAYAIGKPEKTWEIIAPSFGFGGLVVEKRGDQYRMAGSALTFETANGVTDVGTLPPDVPKPKYATGSATYSIYSNQARLGGYMYVDNTGKIRHLCNSGGKPTTYTGDIVWYDQGEDK